MSIHISEIKCPNCGATINNDDKMCEFCGCYFIISEFHDVYTMSIDGVNNFIDSYNRLKLDNGSLGFCYLKLRLYEDAINAFKDSIQNNVKSSEIYFWLAVALLRGKKAFITKRETINQIIEYLNAAIRIEPKGIYFYFLAYIKKDYFDRKYLVTKPTCQEYLHLAEEYKVFEDDISMLFSILNVENPFDVN